MTFRSMSSAALLVLMGVLMAGGCQASRQDGTAPKEKDLDPDVARRPGVAEIVKLGGRLKIDDKDPKKPIVECIFPAPKLRMPS